jgi:hypothetical protein
MRSQVIKTITFCAFAILCATSALAQTSFWQGPDVNGGVPGKWETATNWQNSFIPASDHGAFIGNGQAGDIKVNGTATIDSDTGTATTGTLVLGAGTITAGGQDNGTLYMNTGATPGGGTLLITNPSSINGANLSLSVGGVGNAGGGGAGTFIMNDGTLDFGGTAVGGFLLGLTDSTSSPRATGYYEMNGGVVNFLVAGANHLSLSVRGQGTMLMTNGSVNLNGGSVDISRAGGFGTLLMNGGTITTNILIGATAAGGQGTVIIDGGQINATTLNNVNSNGAASATLDVKSGTLNVSGATTIANGTLTTGVAIFEGGTTALGTTLTIVGNGTTNTGSAFIKGGTLNVGSILVSASLSAGNATTSTATLSISGGTTIVTGVTNLNRAGVTNFILSGGELDSGSVSFSNHQPNASMTGGTLTTSQTVGSIAFSGGTISPGTIRAGGGADFGTMNVAAGNTQSFTQGANSHLHLDLGQSTSQKDLVAILNPTTTTNASGGATLNGFIDIDFRGDTDNPPAIGTQWVVLTVAPDDAGNTNSGNHVFLNLNNAGKIISNTPGFVFSEVSSGSAAAGYTLSLQLDAVPEPSILGIAGVAVIGLLRRRQARRMPSCAV